MKMQIGLVTCSQFPTLTHDDALLLNELRARGVNVGIVIWNDEKVEWENIELVVIRTPWYEFWGERKEGVMECSE